MLLPHGAVIALVDGRRFELFRNAGQEAHPELTPLSVPHLDEGNHSAASHRSSTGNHADSLVTEDSHAIAVAAWLNSQVLAHKIAHLVVIAPPRLLGEMRQHYHTRLRECLVGEVSKELCGRKGPEIVAALRGK